MTTLSEFYDEVARQVDQETTKINVAETKRVLAMAFHQLALMDGPEAICVIHAGIQKALRKMQKDCR